MVKSSGYHYCHCYTSILVLHDVHAGLKLLNIEWTSPYHGRLYVGQACQYSKFLAPLQHLENHPCAAVPSGSVQFAFGLLS